MWSKVSSSPKLSDLCHPYTRSVSSIAQLLIKPRRTKHTLYLMPTIYSVSGKSDWKWTIDFQINLVWIFGSWATKEMKIWFVFSGTHGKLKNYSAITLFHVALFIFWMIWLVPGTTNSWLALGNFFIKWWRSFLIYVDNELIVISGHSTAWWLLCVNIISDHHNQTAKYNLDNFPGQQINAPGQILSFIKKAFGHILPQLLY